MSNVFIYILLFIESIHSPAKYVMIPKATGWFTQASYDRFFNADEYLPILKHRDITRRFGKDHGDGA